LTAVVPGTEIAQGDESGTVGLIARTDSGAARVITAGHVLIDPTLPVRFPGTGSSPAFGASQWIDDRVDAAIVGLGSNTWVNRPRGVNVTITSIRHAAVGDVLSMSGATSASVRRARVKYLGQHHVGYSNGSGLEMWGFVLEPLVAGQILSAPGDSGALWWDEKTGAAVGLNVAGGPSAEDPGIWAFACHIGPVFDRFALRL